MPISNRSLLDNRAHYPPQQRTRNVEAYCLLGDFCVHLSGRHAAFTAPLALRQSAKIPTLLDLPRPLTPSGTRILPMIG